MTQYELTKLAGTVISALLLIFGTKTFIDIRNASHGHGGPVMGYALPAPAESASGGAAAEAPAADAGFSFAKVAEALPSASTENGKDVFKKCTACHTVDKGGRALQGPNLWGVVGRPKASVAGFNYSDPMKNKGGDWSYESLAQFVHNPKSYVSGTKMVFAGLSSTQDVADLLAYLRTQADSPAALPGN